MIKRGVGAVLCVALVGCAHVTGYAGAHPAVIHCKGKGVITGTGTAAVTFGPGGSGSNSFSLQADCGSGFDFSQSLK